MINRSVPDSFGVLLPFMTLCRMIASGFFSRVMVFLYEKRMLKIQIIMENKTIKTEADLIQEIRMNRKDSIDKRSNVNAMILKIAHWFEFREEAIEIYHRVKKSSGNTSILSSSFWFTKAMLC